MEKSQEEQQLEQIRVCTEVGQRCLESDPAKRPSAQGIIDTLEQTESKERCIETAAPPASSLVENKNKSTRRNIRIEPFRHSGTIDPVTVARTCKTVTQAICEFYAQGDTNMSLEQLYRDGYNMVLHKKGEELYSAMETTMTSEVQSLSKPLDAAPADWAAFLKELLAKWNQHIKAVNFTRDILMYMDRTFVRTKRKTPIYELGLRLWRDHMARTEIRERLIEAMKRQRGGQHELVAGVNKMLTELGEDELVLECWRHKMEKSQEEQKFVQIRVCTAVGQRCLESDPAKRSCAQGMIDILEQTESKERCIETGVSGSAVPQASSLVENENKSTRQRSFKIEAFKSTITVDPVFVARACKTVTQAICEFYAQGSTNMSLEKLYRDAYNMVLHKKGEELYSVVETTLTSEVQSLCRPLDTALADGALFLEELLAKWNQHIRAVNFARDILPYMDRTFVPTNRKTPIYELGLCLWRDHLARSDNIRESLIESVKRCSGDGGEDELVAGVKKMLTELGEDVPGLVFPDGELHVAGP